MINQINEGLKCVALSSVKFYRNYISSMMLPRCRFHPCCSAYAQKAIEKKGFWRGLQMAGWRLLRCHPFSRASFYDPIEEENDR